MKYACMLRLDGTITAQQAQGLAAAIAPFKPYDLRGNTAAEHILANLSTQDWWEFEGLRDKALFPTLHTLLTHLSLGYAWVATDDDFQSTITIAPPNQTPETFVYANGTLCLPVAELTPTRIAAATQSFAFFQSMTLTISSAHARLSYEAAVLASTDVARPASP